jgi:hypothetical protein
MQAADIDLSTNDLSGNAYSSIVDLSTNNLSDNVAVVVSSPTRYTYREIDALLTQTYNSMPSNSSMICDIVVLYLKGQKLLYTEAKTVCEQKLHYLMLPSIFLTVLGSVLNLVIKDTAYGATIVSSLNAFTAFLLAVVNYLKLDARAEAHRTTAYKLDKLQNDLVFNSGRMLFLEGAAKGMEVLIDNTHKEVKEIKETNPFVLPETIRYSYPLLFSMNIFATVKKIQTKEIILTTQLKDLYNDIEAARSQGKDFSVLETQQRSTLLSIINMRDEYVEIDSSFAREMKKNQTRCSNRIQICGFLKV